MHTINISQQLGTNDILSVEDGEKLYEIIKPLLENGEVVEMSFAGIKGFTFAFINSTLSRLIMELEYDNVISSIRLVDIPNTTLIGVIQDYISTVKYREISEQSKEEA